MNRTVSNDEQELAKRVFCWAYPRALLSSNLQLQCVGKRFPMSVTVTRVSMQKQGPYRSANFEWFETFGSTW